MENIQNKYIQIENRLFEIRELISHELGNNPYEDLNKMIKSVSQKNYSQVLFIRNKIKNLSMLLYNRNLECGQSVFDKLNEVYLLLADDIEMQ